MLAALSGILGYGVWTKDHKGTVASCVVEYERILRVNCPTPLILRCDPRGADTLKLNINRDYIDQVRVNEILPQPSSIIQRRGELQYCFLIRDSEIKKIEFTSRAKSAGRVSLRIGYDTSFINIKQIILP